MFFTIDSDSEIDQLGNPKINVFLSLIQKVMRLTEIVGKKERKKEMEGKQISYLISRSNGRF